MGWEWKKRGVKCKTEGTDISQPLTNWGKYPWNCAGSEQKRQAKPSKKWSDKWGKTLRHEQSVPREKPETAEAALEGKPGVKLQQPFKQWAVYGDPFPLNGVKRHLWWWPHCLAPFLLYKGFDREAGCCGARPLLSHLEKSLTLSERIRIALISWFKLAFDDGNDG